MRRKIRRNRNKFRFTAKALNLPGREAIIEKAEEQHINVKKGGRPNIRLNFACSREKWHRFYREIKALCVNESPVMCQCPQWLRRRMVKNLYMAIRNDKLNTARANSASRILASLNR